METRCPKCGGLVVYDRERFEYVCALCDEPIVEIKSSLPYKPEYLEAIYIVRITTKEMAAKELIRRHAEDATIAIAFSGKDSLVALHLTISAGVEADVVIASHVANMSLPRKIVDELRAIVESVGARRVIIHDKPWDVHASLFRIVSRKYGYDVIVTGLRRRENRHHHAVERLIVKPGRVIKLVNPIINWSTQEVWSYIYHYNLPIPSPYRLAPPDASLQHIVLF